MSVAVLVALIGVAGALVLAVRSLRARTTPAPAMVWMAGAWVAIIVLAAMMFGLASSHGDLDAKGAGILANPIWFNIIYIINLNQVRIR